MTMQFREQAGLKGRCASNGPAWSRCALLRVQRHKPACGRLATALVRSAHSVGLGTEKEPDASDE